MANLTDSQPAKPAETRRRVDDTIWVICASPVTLLMPTGKEDAAVRAQVPLKLERGLNVLAGWVPDGSSLRYMTLDGLSSDLQQRAPEERGPAVLEMFEAAKKLYAPMFKAVGNVPPRIIAVGTIKELATGEHITALHTAATNGTHKGSLEALVALPVTLVPEHIKDLARTRLAAWRPAA